MKQLPPTTRRDTLAKIATVMGLVASGTWTEQVAIASPRRTIVITAQRFQFTPRSIEIKRGETVRLQITAVDFAHGFYVPDLKLRADLVPGKVVTLDITAKKVGTLDFLCDNFCGEGHEGMHGQFIVSK